MEYKIREDLALFQGSHRKRSPERVQSFSDKNNKHTAQKFTNSTNNLNFGYNINRFGYSRDIPNLDLCLNKNNKMKITITGSLGNISQPLAKELISMGHDLTIISSNQNRQKDIEELGATAAIGTIEDVDFLTSAFKDAELVYCMEPPPNFFETDRDVEAHHIDIAKNYAQAVKQTGVKRLIHLSSVGAHRADGIGMLSYHYQVENILGSLSNEINITFMRPVGFYYNLLSYIPGIKAKGVIVSNFGGNQKEPWVSPIDIAAAIAREVQIPPESRKVVYVASDEISCNEIAHILGEAIGQPDLKWIQKSEAELLKDMTDIGMNPRLANGLVQMNTSRGNGILYEEYFKNRPVPGKVKLTDFAKEFAASFKDNE